jgi:hypothetical protein
MAYAAALSIKNTQKPGYDKVALIIDDESKLADIKSPWVFDEVIEWKNEKGWDGRSWMDVLSPWDNTICIDADMLFLRDCSHWVKYFINNCDLYISSNAYTYRGEVITNKYYRKSYLDNAMPTLYSFFTFFKKDKIISKEFFNLNRFIIKYPQEFINCFLEKNTPKVVGTDEAFSLAAKILDISNEISYDLSFPKVVHLKSMVQNWPWDSTKFTDCATVYFNKSSRLKLENFIQTDVVHYVEKDLMTDKYIGILEEILWKK